MKGRIGVMVVGWVAMTILMLMPREAEAIAAWARKYGTNCQTCHVGGYKLTATGQDFLRNGHQMLGNKGEEGIGGYVSLTSKMRAYMNRTSVNSANADSSSFEMHNFTIYTGGPLDSGFSYFTEMYFSENSGKTSGTSDFDDYGRSKLAESVLEYLYGSEDSHWHFRAGQLLPSLLHLHGVGARLSQDRPTILGSKVGDNPYQPFTRQFGLTAAKKVKDLYVEVGIVNGTGAATYNRVDNNWEKDVWGTVDYSFDSLGSMMGLYVYKGLYPLVTDKPTTYNSDDSFYQFGAVGHLTTSQGSLVGAFFAQNDSYGKITGGSMSVNSLGGYLELQYYMNGGELTPFIRGDYFDKDTNTADNEKLGVTLGVNWKWMEHGQMVFHVNNFLNKTGVATTESTTNQILVEMQFMY